MSIDGGGSFHGTNSRSNRSTTSPATTENPRVIFGETSTNTVSDPVLVTAGKAIVLYADNLSGSDIIYVQRAVMGQGVSMTSGCNANCGDILLGIASVNQRIQMTLGGNKWALSATMNTLVIPIPGIYVFELNSEEAIGEVSLSFAVIDYKHRLPDSYMMGTSSVQGV